MKHTCESEEGEIAPPSPRSWKTAWLYTAAIALGMLVAAITAFSVGDTFAFFDVTLSPPVRLGAIWLSLMAGILAGRGVFWLANEFEAKHRRAARRDDGPR
ncbi:Uncharacterised protein [Mycobacteroides abscessus subsp. massiliense]|nr:Uncharacterised protein [Mycobacteroides abscessus subsp. abscessus]SKU93327.1 Uncharacterised protein [Mycobacteroides abscessus subsp. massiliense]SIE18832.1 Uncharacterised protein [Mycobacteroides abscessus subsp. abscessus]SIF97730.1 Uncharacterised protein [Mycobacteroides abscessus subsp. abscessus]SIG06923.1 Uncharacterised protein [Mycobacteroides abscessus subsp. abscessus]